MSVHIIDSGMGSGKSSWARQHMNAHAMDQRFIFITPFNTEVDKTIHECPMLGFKKGSVGTKMRDFTNGISQGKNVVGTHEALRRLTDYEAIKDCNYTLILDEALSVVHDIQEYSKADIEILLAANAIAVDDTGKVTWTFVSDEMTMRHADLIEMSQCGKLFLYDNKFFLWVFPPDAFDMFKDVYVLTYLFHAQYIGYYMDYHGIAYDKLMVVNDGSEYSLEPHDGYFGGSAYSELIDIYDGPLNDIGDKGLTKSWYTAKGQGKRRAKIVSDNIRNFFRRSNAKSSDAMWTAFKGCGVNPKGYNKGFVAVNARATNDFQNRTTLAYMVDYRPRPKISNVYFGGIDEDLWSLSDLVQWIFRSAIRKEVPEKISLYIPSARMRDILRSWLNDDKSLGKSNFPKTPREPA